MSYSKTENRDLVSRIFGVTSPSRRRRRVNRSFRPGRSSLPLAVTPLEDRQLLSLGGSYHLTFTAADPSLYTHYVNGTGAYQAVVNAAPTGSTTTDPIANADYGAPRVSLTSLAPPTMTLGQIVPFEIQISVDNTTDAPTNGQVQIVADWLTKTTPGDNFGYDPNVGSSSSPGILAAFIDRGDSATVPSPYTGGATVSGFTSSLIPPDATDPNYRIHATFIVSGLNPGDNVILEPWLVLDSHIAPGTSGNVQSSLVSATALGSPTNPGSDTINTGNQTVPLLKVQEFLAPPVAVGDFYDCVDAGQTYTVAAPGVLANDTSPANDPLTAVLVSGPAHNAASPPFVLNSDGSFSYTPDPTWVAAQPTGSHPTDSFTYYAHDSVLNLNSNNATVTLTIDRAPVAGSAALGTVAPGGSATTTSSLVSDPDADFVTLTSALDPSIGTLALNADGTLTFTAAAGAHGSYTIPYTVTDSLNSNGTANPHGCLTATGDLTVTVDTAPTVAQGSLPCVDVTKGTASATGTVSVGDADNDPLTLSLVGAGTNQDGGAAYGTLTFTNNPVPVSGGAGTGTFSYAVAALPAGAPTGKHLSDTFTYKANDGYLDSATSTITVTLDRAPVAPNYSNTVVMNSPTGVSGNVLTGTSDPDADNITIASYTPPPAADGTFTFDSTTGAYTFVPASNFSGSATFTYTITDSKNADGTANLNGCLSATGTVTITVASAARTQGYWKTHETSTSSGGFWTLNNGTQVTSLTIGGATYTPDEVVSIMNMSAGTGTSANAILILFDQLVAAELNVLNGVNASTADQMAIADGNQAIKDAAAQANVSTTKLLGSKKGSLTWYQTTTVAYVPVSSSLGQRMVGDANTLNAFNNSGV